MDVYQTLNYYAQNANDFVSQTLTADMSDARTRFASHLPVGAYILDFGCGSGRDTKAFLESGYHVDAVDGSEALCAKASEYTGIQVRKMLFTELNAIDTYDGIWACASILHLPKPELADVLNRIQIALKHNGIFYTSFKYGTHEGMRDGRFFTDFTLESLDLFWDHASPLHIFDTWLTRDVRSGRKETLWLNVLGRRV